jgi:methyltransferase family protein
MRGGGLRSSWRRARAALAPPRWREFDAAVGDADTVLDVGCGDDSPLGHFAGRFRRLVGVEADSAAAERARARGIHDEVRVLDVRSLADELEPGSYDAVVALDLLEHLEKLDGGALLAALEGIARRRVVVFTPNGFVPQDDVGGSEWQRHRSGWTAAELRARGYRVTGMQGLRPLRGALGDARWRPRRAWLLVSDLSQPLARRAPRLAYHLLAVKEVQP